MTQVSYPGVYIDDKSSGVRTITGVATSIAAFIGGASNGPTDKATLVTSFTEYAKLFGQTRGLDRDSNLGYAVNAFFANGGQQAYIVRVVGDDAAAATAKLGDLELAASSPGKWANEYSVVSKKTDDDEFQLTVYRKQIVVESFEKLSIKKEDARYVGRILADGSAILRVAKDPASTTLPPEKMAPLEKGTDGEKILDPTTAPDAFLTALNVPAAPNTPPEPGKGGLALLEAVDLFNLLCIPGLTPATDKARGKIKEIANYCLQRRAFYVVDGTETAPELAKIGNFAHENSALYYPWVTGADPLAKNRPRAFPPSGFVAGIYSRTDSARGVWKAPAGTEATLTGVLGPTKPLTDTENGNLNPRAVNCIRNFPGYGTVLWGARTLHGDDERGSEWKYVPVRRLTLFLEETLFRALKWVVFEPNDEPLWAQIRLNVGAFMNDMFRQGAFQGSTPQDAYFVKCDKETTTQNDINKGIVNIVVGFAPLKPAEFVVVQIQQIAGQIAA